jgi:two-component system alkaline phosphatase synthesis response regulator PhoP
METKKILIVDDEADIVKALQIRLEREGYAIITAYDGENAIKKVKEEKPDLIILDIIMPKMDGLQVCEILKNTLSTQNIPIIMLTAKSMGSDFDAAMDKKADWYIVKPFNFEHLLRRIKGLL